MRWKAFLMLAASGFGVVCLAQRHSDRWTVTEQETVEKNMTLSGEPMRLVVDNLDGYVHVTGTDSPRVHVVAHKVIRAETQADLNQAKSEVKLEMEEQPGSVSVTYSTPWRCNGNCGNCCSEKKHFYEVTYDIDVEAPRNARMVVSTVNGQLQLRQVDGDFDVHGVNGGVQMNAIAGAGDVHTVNGAVSIQFARNPLRACSFKSVNGALEAHFQPGLSADLQFKTMNGQIYSDFDVAPMILPAAGEAERKDGRFVYRSNRMAAGRAGKGGPELSFDTLNGGIRLYQEQQ